MPGPGCDGLKRRHEGGLAVVIGPYLAHGILPFRDKPGAHVASVRPLQVRGGGLRTRSMRDRE